MWKTCLDQPQRFTFLFLETSLYFFSSMRQGCTVHTYALLLTICIGKMPLLSERFDKLDVSANIHSNIPHGIAIYHLISTSLLMGTQCLSVGRCQTTCLSSRESAPVNCYWIFYLRYELRPFRVQSKSHLVGKTMTTN